MHFFFFFQAEDGIRDVAVTGVQTCALPIYLVVPADLRASKGTTRSLRGHLVAVEFCGLEQHVRALWILAAVAATCVRRRGQSRRVVELISRQGRTALAAGPKFSSWPSVELPMKVLVATSIYPTTENPAFGSFVRTQLEYLRR